MWLSEAGNTQVCVYIYLNISQLPHLYLSESLNGSLIFEFYLDKWLGSFCDRFCHRTPRLQPLQYEPLYGYMYQLIPSSVRRAALLCRAICNAEVFPHPHHICAIGTLGIVIGDRNCVLFESELSHYITARIITAIRHAAKITTNRWNYLIRSARLAAYA